VELITDPSLIFLDEPTTGLDSFTAATVMDLLNGLAQSGRTIITTIHQPNTDIFNSFDRLLMLAKGKIVFFNEAKLAVDYFASLGERYRCPEWNNPADFFMDLISIESIDPRDSKDGRLIPVEEIHMQYNKGIAFLSESYQLSSLRNNYAFTSNQATSIPQLKLNLEEASYFYQFMLVMRRNFVVYLRNPKVTVVRVVSTIGVAVLAAIMFQGLTGDFTGVRNRNGLLFFANLCCGGIAM